MKEIGGFFELELPQKKEYHKNAIKLNNGRNAIRLFLCSSKIKKFYVPYYICNTVIEQFEKENVKYEFYNINREFEINNKIKLLDKEFILYVNYFGIKSEYILNLVNLYKEKLIIDNSQAFFDLPYNKIITIYSPRKFFGVPDGGYLYNIKNDYINNIKIKKYNPKSITHLIGRIEDTGNKYYKDYIKSENILEDENIQKMSNLTKRILSSIDYNHVKKVRLKNFNFLHKNLKKINQINISLNDKSIPMVYPFLLKKKGLKEYLIKNKIYIPTYWKEVLNRKNITKTEQDFVNFLVSIPIDQRYNINGMKIIINNINNFLGKK